ncbi:MAG: hypothetical protein U0U66_00630 [Cytophagaceae bacterium]
MKIPSPPYHGATNELLYALLTGGDCIGYEDLSIYSMYPSGLSYPEKTAYALIVVEADTSTSNKAEVLRFREFDSQNMPPTDYSGMPLGHLSIYEVKGAHNLAHFQAIGIEQNKVHTLRIQYFG